MKNHDHDDQEQVISAMFSKYGESYIRLSKDRVIFLSEIVTKESATELSALLLYYDHSQPGQEITLYINSDGGDAAGLTNIYDVMQMLESPVKTVCMGRAYSAGAVLLAAGTPGKRYAFKHSEIMIHGIQCAFPILGHDQVNSKNHYQFLKDINDNIMKMLADHTGHPLDKIKSDCSRDKYLTAKQALEYGIIDHII